MAIAQTENPPLTGGVRRFPDRETPQRVSSKALLGSRRELVIVHEGREYRLRHTQNGKLILTA